jgi:superfamily I DNA/RNA helicase
MSETWWIKPEELDEDQKRIVSLPLDKNYLVLGPPGSGKTNLLLLRASHLYKGGYPDIAILLFSRKLQEFVASGASKYFLSTDVIKTSTRWLMDFIRNNDGRIRRSNDFIENRLNLLTEAKRIVDHLDLDYHIEAILLDEAQDYLPEEIKLFSQMSKRLFAVADSKQKIYNGESSLDTLKEIVDATCELRYHYRNGLKICKLADGLSKDSSSNQLLSPTANYNEDSNPSKVDVIKSDNFEEQLQRIIERIDIQLKTYPGELIGIISPRRDETNLIGEFFLKSHLTSKVNFQDSEEGFILDTEKPIIITTVHSAKGLEFRALHIVSSEYIKKFPKQRNIAFTAITRTKTSLSIYHVGDIPGFFEQAIVNIQSPPQMPEFKDLFNNEGLE